MVKVEVDEAVLKRALDTAHDLRSRLDEAASLLFGLLLQGKLDEQQVRMLRLMVDPDLVESVDARAAKGPEELEFHDAMRLKRDTDRIRVEQWLSENDYDEYLERLYRPVDG